MKTSNILVVKLYLVILICLYLICFDWMYVSWLSPNFGYFGVEYHPKNITLIIISHIFSILPCFWIPIKLHRPSILIYWFIYLLTYIPSLILPVFINLSEENDLYILMVSLFFGMLIMSLFYFIPLLKITSLKITYKRAIRSILIITTIIVIYLVIIYHGHFRLVGLDDIYDVRYASDDISKGNLSGYAVMILGLCMFPLFFSLGLIRKNIYILILSFLGQILIYSTTGAKTNLFSCLILVGLYFLIKKNKKIFGIKFIIFFILLISVLNYLSLYSPPSISVVIAVISTIVFLRTICIGGMLTAQYYYYFSFHPKTYFSHVNLINKIIPYPYGDVSVGRVIGYFFSGDQLLNSNANFWATDGIASQGMCALLFISILCGLVFWIYDSVSRKHDINFAAISAILICMTLLNTSLFTTLFSGGFGLMILILYLFPSQQINPTLKYSFKKPFQ